MAALDLRPLSLGELLDRTFFLYRRHFWLFVGIAALPYLLLVAVVLVPAVFLYALPARGGTPGSIQTAAGIVGFGLLMIVGLGVFIAFLYSAGAAVFAVSELYAGRTPTIRESYRLVRGKAGTILGVMVFSGFIVVAGFLALIIPGLYLLCRIPAAIPAAMVENIGSGPAIRRSFHLTKGFAGRAALIYLLAVALTYGVGLMFQLPFLALVAMSTKQPQMTVLWTALAQVVQLLGSILVAPMYSIGFALLYYDLRVRKEALDLQMMMQAIGADPAPPAPEGGVPSMFGRDAS